MPFANRSRLAPSLSRLMGGEASLEELEHPERAVYLLGAEDAGLPESAVRAAHRHVTLPCERYESFTWRSRARWSCTIGWPRRG